MYPGNHFFIAEHLDEVTRAIAQDLSLFLRAAQGGYAR
jgi:surfactin synthase thioesterase subunit